MTEKEDILEEVINLLIDQYNNRVFVTGNSTKDEKVELAYKQGWKRCLEMSIEIINNLKQSSSDNKEIVKDLTNGEQNDS